MWHFTVALIIIAALLRLTACPTNIAATETTDGERLERPETKMAEESW